MLRAGRMSQFVVVALGLGLGRLPLCAQSIAGAVVHPDGVTPASGVIVTATPTSGAAPLQALTNPRGEFSLRLPGPGRYALRVLRIGYQPTLGPTIVVANDETTEARIVLSSRVVSLAIMNIRDRETCRVSADTGLMVARAWEEARKAMLSSQLAGGDAPLVAEWIEYDRTLDSASRVVKAQRVRTSRNPTTHAFRSRSAVDLDTAGYVRTDASGTTYFAPDAEVLLSETFAAAHCFRVAESPRESPGLIGVAFQPSRDRLDMHEIEGTLWLDRASAELRTLEFRFTGLGDAAAAAGAGGRVEFLRLREGSWLVSRWSLRMPRLEARRSPAIGLQKTMMSVRAVLHGVQVSGGEVTRVLRRDSLIYEASGPRVIVQVLGADSLVGVAGATLTLEGTDYAGSADSSGRIEMAPVLGGRYRARLRTPLMDALGISAVAGEIEARDVPRADTIRLPSARDVLRQACPRDAIENGKGMLRGVVRDERDRALARASVVATWKADVSIVGEVTGDRLRYTETSLATVSDEDGRWRICGVPLDVLLSVRAVSDSGSGERQLRVLSSFSSVTLVARRFSVMANREIAAALGQSERPSALVEFAVVNSAGEPLPGVSLDVRGSGAARAIVTGPGGRALLPDVPSGLLVVRARRVGFRQGEVTARVEAGRNVVPILMSEVSTPSLDTVRVTGDRGATGLGRTDGFDQRRLTAAGGRFVTADEIGKQNPLRVTEILRRVPGVTLRDSAGVTLAVSGRGLKVMRVGERTVPAPCTMRIGVDGMLRENGFDMNLLSPNDVYGIEVYTPATVPPQYNGAKADSFCGLIMIWTK